MQGSENQTTTTASTSGRRLSGLYSAVPMVWPGGPPTAAPRGARGPGRSQMDPVELSMSVLFYFPSKPFSLQWRCWSSGSSSRRKTKGNHKFSSTSTGEKKVYTGILLKIKILNGLRARWSKHLANERAKKDDTVVDRVASTRIVTWSWHRLRALHTMPSIVGYLPFGAAALVVALQTCLNYKGTQ